MNLLQRTIGWCLLMVAGWPLAFGQTGNNTAALYQERYERGKQQYEQGDYTAAIEAFRSLSRTEANNPYTTYASFFFALSAFQQQDYALAKNMLLQIKSKYPKWNKMGEVDYWLANAYFELGDYAPAMALIDSLDQQKGITRGTLEDAQKMRAFYVSRLTDPARLQSLLEIYPEDKVIATQLVEQLVTSDDPNTALKDSLVQAFQIDEASFGVASQASSIKKNAYNVAAFLPFFYDKLTTENERVGNEFVVELYQSMRMAADDLQKEGINVRLHAYDTERDYEATQRLLEKEEILNMDVIVGPLFPGPFRAVSEFTQEHQIYMFNPVSTNPLVVQDNPFSFLSKPSMVTEARRAAHFARDTLNRSVAIVVTDGSKQDTARIGTFVRTFRAKDPSRKVYLRVLRDFNAKVIEGFVDTLVYYGERNEAEPPVVYVASNNELVITNSISAVVMANTPLTVIGNDSWFDITSITYEQLEELGVHFLSPGYTQPRRRSVKRFAEAYRKKYNVVPSKYAYAGYDAMYYIGRMLQEYGTYFQEFYTGARPVKSRLFAGYNYYEAQDNQVVPVIRFEEGVLRAVQREEE
ncbi:MAG: ABC transporter substrate-binding protein [Tunicatimonas sp.]